MKLIIYDTERKVVKLYEGIQRVKVNNDEVTWNDGALMGIKLDFILLNDEVEVLEKVTEEVINQDLKQNYKEISLEDENRQLKERLEATEMAVLSLLELM
ncbi:hypothetical protein M3936_03630 [Sutcliffiella horikoshii]|uniref:hypothetical protein n=1 Tax=Sutcliffiella horikoshii TaxID=79883 RepID=UPI00203D1DE3|nr:hypothetical protein [Sutcliffiella horikoshii]MCM3616667.1 hypothetical protein [Sutcliffiella horikoshii]